MTAITPGRWTFLSGLATAAIIASTTLEYTAYFIRLRVMSHVAKSDDRAASIRYFVEEQMLSLRAGFGMFLGSGAALAAVAIGVLSQGTGISGALILLDARENACCVPVNRASSVLAGALASATLAWAGLAHGLPASELWGAASVLAAIVVLATAPAAPHPPEVTARLTA